MPPIDVRDPGCVFVVAVFWLSDSLFVSLCAARGWPRVFCLRLALSFWACFSRAQRSLSSQFDRKNEPSGDCEFYNHCKPILPNFFEGLRPRHRTCATPKKLTICQTKTLRNRSDRASAPAPLGAVLGTWGTPARTRRVSAAVFASSSGALKRLMAKTSNGEFSYSAVQKTQIAATMWPNLPPKVDGRKNGNAENGRHGEKQNKSLRPLWGGHKNTGSMVVKGVGALCGLQQLSTDDRDQSRCDRGDPQQPEGNQSICGFQGGPCAESSIYEPE